MFPLFHLLGRQSPPAQGIKHLRRLVRILPITIGTSINLLTASPLPAADPTPTPLPVLSDDARAAATKGLDDFRNGKFDDAKSEFQKMSELAPNHPMAWANLGSAEFRLGQFPEAEEHLKRALRLDPTAQQSGSSTTRKMICTPAWRLSVRRSLSIRRIPKLIFTSGS
jgi:tetratricopeptide (TPR) repeat protein